jgi:hypothetical protein
MEPTEVSKIIKEERDYQNKDVRELWEKNGTEVPERKELGSWLMVMRHYLDKAEDNFLDYVPEEERVECIRAIAKLTTVGYACLEQYGDILEEKGLRD